MISGRLQSNQHRTAMLQRESKLSHFRGKCYCSQLPDRSEGMKFST